MVARAWAAVGAAARRGRHPSAWSVAASAMLAYADLLAGDPATARDRAAQGRAMGGDVPAETAFTLAVVHGAARSDLGDRAAGLAEMRAGRVAVAGLRWPTSLFVAMAVLEHRGALLLGNAAAADEVVGWLSARVGRVGEVLLLEAWAAMAAGNVAAARDGVRPVGDDVPALLPHTRVEVLLVEAEAALRAGDAAAWAAALDEALARAGASGIVRPLVFAGPWSRDALETRPAARGTGPIATLLAAARAAIATEAAPLLSEREREVLGLLPSLLTTASIAEELTVSVNTVKSHVRAIYARLDASSRREAVLRARERGLLP